MRIWLVISKHTQTILCAFTEEERAQVYADDLNASLERRGISMEYYVQTTYLAKDVSR